MTSQKDIQSLLDDIEGILPKAESRLPWSKPGEVAPVRRVLERVRSFLISQQQNLVASSEKPATSATPQQQEVLQQLVQAVAGEINVIRADLIKPLQTDVQALRKERDSLLREVRQLESKKQQIDAVLQHHGAQQQIISEFSQGLISRCSESLTQQLAQTLVNLEAHLLNTASTSVAITPSTGYREAVSSVLPPQERVEQLRRLQAQSDELMITLDANQRAIFDALQRNLQSYQESLSLGLENMHRLGLQGEMLFAALVNSLAQKLGPEASTILQSSPPFSDSVTQTNLAITPAKPDTLLPSDALRGTQLFSYPSPVAKTQIPLQSVEQIPQPTAENTFLEHHLSPDWELIEGLDIETPDLESDANQEIETFIQLDIDSQDLLPTIDETENTFPEYSQEQYDLLGAETALLSTATPQSQASELPRLDALDTASELNLISDSRREEIEDLYESIFGKDSSLDTSSESDPSAPQALSTAFLTQWDEQFSQLESDSTDQTNLSSQLEEALFEGLEDPANEVIETQQPDKSVTELPSWEDLFVEDSVTATPLDGDTADKKVSKQESIKTIAALTDLFEEMNLRSNPLAIINNNSIAATTIPELEYPISNTEPQVSLTEERLEEHYITASPDENLLTTNESETNSELEILLDQNTLQQLSEDLYSFEEPDNENVQRENFERSLDNYAAPPNVVPEPERVNPQNHWLLRSDELLAEDWEEFAFHDLYDEDFTSLSPANSTKELTVQEVVELDFDPGLFPSETLELDQENANKLSTSEPLDLAVKAELVAPEDEAFVEMQWNDPIDNTTEETIASSELQSNSDSLSKPAIDSDKKASNKKVQDDSLG